jgi:hypothetical protein
MRPRRQAAARSVRRRVSLSSALCVLVVSCGNGGGAAEDSLEAEVPATDDVVTTQVLLESTAAPASEVTTVPTVRVDSVPSTVSATSEVPVVSSSTSPSPLEAGDFDVELPAVEGYSYTPVPERPVPWEQLDLPGFLSGYAFGVRQSGVSIGTIVVLDQFGLTGYIKQLFDETVRLAGANGAEGSVRAGWRALGGAPVLALTLPSGMVGQWVWGHDGRTWVAVGDLAMEGYVAGLIGRQQEVAPMDPHDYELLAGGLYRRLFEIPGFLYVDLPVAEAVAALPNTLFGDCAQRLYLGHVVPVHDPDPLIMDPDDLALMAASIAGACEDGGFFNDLDTALQALPNMRKEASDARLLYRNESNVVVVEGDDVFHLTSSDPAKLVEMEPFITQFISGVKPTSPTGTSIPPGAREMFDLAEIDRVGMCVFIALRAFPDRTSWRAASSRSTALSPIRLRCTTASPTRRLPTPPIRARPLSKPEPTRSAS